MASYTWKSAQTGNWSAVGNWTPTGGPPGFAGGDTVLIDATPANYTITYDEGSAILNSLTINSGTATLSFSANDHLTINNGTTLQAGTINLLNSGAVLNAGVLTTTSGSTINIGSGAILNDNGATVGGVVDMTGTTAFGSTIQSIVLNGTIEATGGTGTVNFSGITGTGALEANGATLLVTGGLGSNSTLKSVISNSAASVFEINGQHFLDKPFPSNSSVRWASFRIKTRSPMSS